jgi:hypothetical protein
MTACDQRQPDKSFYSREIVAAAGAGASQE